MRAGSKHRIGAVLAAALVATVSVVGPASAADGAGAAGQVHIKGTVDAASDGRALRGSYVYVYATDGTQLTLGFSGRTGKYDLAIDDPTSDNRYLVCFDPRFVSVADDEPGYLPQCYDGAQWRGSGPPTGTAVRATAAAPATGIDAHLAASGAIAGQVSSSLDGPMAGVDVFLYSAPGHNVGGTQTGSDGRYVLHGLPPATYLVCVNPYLTAHGESVGGYGARCDGGGRPVTVAAGEVRAHVDAVLPVLGAISGTVSVAGSPLSGAKFSPVVFDATGARVGSVTLLGTDGSYRVSLLPPSRSYTVCVRTRNVTLTDPAGLLQPQCYDGVWWDTPADSPPPGGTAEVRVQAGVDTAGIDFVMVQGGAISGAVQLPQSFGQGTRVEVYAGRRLVATDYARRSPGGAKYAVPGLAPGRYSVCFDNLTNSYFGSSQCWSDQTWSGPGTPLPAERTVLRVRAGTVISHVDATLAPSGAITGQLMGADGRYVYAAVATVLDPSGDLVARVPVGSSFDLELPASVAGYVVCVDPADTTGYLPRCWHNRAWDGDSAHVPSGTTSVPVTNGALSSELDFVLPLADP